MGGHVWNVKTWGPSNQKEYSISVQRSCATPHTEDIHLWTYAKLHVWPCGQVHQHLQQQQPTSETVEQLVKMGGTVASSLVPLQAHLNASNTVMRNEIGCVCPTRPMSPRHRTAFVFGRIHGTCAAHVWSNEQGGQYETGPMLGRQEQEKVLSVGDNLDISHPDLITRQYRLLDNVTQVHVSLDTSSDRRVPFCVAAKLTAT